MVNQTLFVLAILAILATLGALASSASAGILTAIFVKPFLDASWSSRFGEINPGRIFGVLVPALILWTILAKKRINNIYAIRIWTVYVLYALLTATFMLINFGPLDAVQSFFRTLNGFVGYLMIPLYFHKAADFRKLVLVLIATGFFPIGVGLYQAVTGVVWNPQQNLSLVRYSGFYHDVAGLRYVLLQTIIGLLLYWSYFKPVAGRSLKGLLCIILIAAVGIVMFRTYSKAAIVIAVAWMLIWSWGRRAFLPMLGLVFAVIAANVVFSNRLWDETETLFSREMAALDDESGDRTTDRALSGRVGLWEDYWQVYLDRPAIEQLVGDGNVRAAHNDYLSTLLAGGLIGLVIYVALLWTMGSRIIRLYWRERSPLNVAAMMLFAMWMIDTLGLTPRQYPSYQWFAWGIIGLAIRGIDWGPSRAPKRVAAEDAGAEPEAATEDEPAMLRRPRPQTRGRSR
jgi:O-antigen ligase